MESTEDAGALQPNEIRDRKSTTTSKATDVDKDEKKNNELSTKEAYFASLTEWAKQAALIQMFPNYLLANYSYPQQLQSQTPFPAQVNNEHLMPNRPNLQPQAAHVPPAGVPPFNRFRMLDEVQQQDVIRRVGGTEMVVAPFWKRFVAEAIDMFILFLLKIIATFALFHLFDLEFDKEVMRKSLDDEDLFVNFMDLAMDFFSMSSDLLLIELLTKLMVCSYECLWTTYFDGATPGKSVMKIRILYVEAVLPLQAPVMPQFVFQAQREPMRAILYPAEVPSLLRALMRAFAKNLAMTLLFPICVVMIFFKNNRTAYDIFTKTIVVEANPNLNHQAQPAAIGQMQQRPHQQ